MKIRLRQVEFRGERRQIACSMGIIVGVHEDYRSPPASGGGRHNCGITGRGLLHEFVYAGERGGCLEESTRRVGSAGKSLERGRAGDFNVGMRPLAGIFRPLNAGTGDDRSAASGPALCSCAGSRREKRNKYQRQRSTESFHMFAPLSYGI